MERNIRVIGNSNSNYYLEIERKARREAEKKKNHYKQMAKRLKQEVEMVKNQRIIQHQALRVHIEPSTRRDSPPLGLFQQLVEECNQYLGCKEISTNTIPVNKAEFGQQFPANNNKDIASKLKQPTQIIKRQKKTTPQKNLKFERSISKDSLNSEVIKRGGGGVESKGLLKSMDLRDYL